MDKKLKDFGRRGVKVGEAKSSKGDKVYTLYYNQDTGIVSCDCIGFTMRKRCRHVDEYLDKENLGNEGGKNV